MAQRTSNGYSSKHGLRSALRNADLSGDETIVDQLDGVGKVGTRRGRTDAIKQGMSRDRPDLNKDSDADVSDVDSVTARSKWSSSACT